VVLRFLPYLGVALGFLVWRVFIFDSSRPTTDLDGLFSDYASLPVHMLLRLITETFKDFFETVVLAWLVPFNNLLYPDRLQDLLVGGLVGMSAAALALWLFRMLRRHSPDVEDSQTYREWLLVGAFATLVTLLPHIIAGRDVNYNEFARADHYTIQASLGAAILLVGLGYLFLKRSARLPVLALLVGISVFTHYQQNTTMRDFWNLQKSIWWQLSWRAPGLQPDTLLVAALPAGFSYSEGYEAWAPANFLYYPAETVPPITGEVLYGETLDLILRGGEQPKTHRGIPVNRNFDHLLVLSKPDEFACLNVIDGRKFELSGQEDQIVRVAAPYSVIDRIQLDVSPRQLPTEIFGPEPEHAWCYYYQKAMAARQAGDWEEVVRLGDEVMEKGYGPTVRSEWMPFMEGYASLGRDKDARRLAAIIKTEFGPRNLICKQLDESPLLTDGYAYEKVLEYLCGYD
jgi:hypothetical protein